MGRAASSAKHKILLAAADVVDRVGAGHLTLDAVAEESRLSKGGLLYHFPNKRALLSGMLDLVLSQVEARAREAERRMDQPDAKVAALILAQQSRDDNERAMSRAIIAAAAEDPSLLDPARELIERWFHMARTEGRYGLLVLLAVEGLRFMEMLNLVTLPADERHRLYAQMTELAGVKQ